MVINFIEVLKEYFKNYLFEPEYENFSFRGSSEKEA